MICPAALPASSVPGWTRHRPRWSADIRYSSVLGLAAAPPTGIVDDVQGALPTSTARLLNAWQGRAGGGFVSVYAGAAAGDANQGVVVVVTLEDARHPTLGQQLVKTPSRSGALRVTAANGSLLTLQAEGARASPSTSPPGASGSQAGDVLHPAAATHAGQLARRGATG